MLSNKILASFLILSVVAMSCTAELEDWDDLDNSNPNNPFLYDQDLFMRRETADEFFKDTDERAVDLVKQLAKRKHDAEEVREIEAKADSRRKKAYKNYEEACNIKGKFKVRTCLPLKECFAKNKQKYIPLASELKAANKTTVAPVLNNTTAQPITKTTKKSIFGKGGKREFLERALALSFLEDDDEMYSSEDDDGDFVIKRFFKSKPKDANPELTEETKERKTKAFKKYEEYCEKRKFRIGSTRNCPPLDIKLC